VSRFSGTSKRTAAILGGAIFLVLIVAVGVASGLGDESVDSDSVAVVDGDQIPKADFDAALQQAVTRQQLPEAPAEDSPEYEALRDEAMNQVLDVAWILGEAEERDVSVTDREVQQEFEQTKSENFKTEQEYQDFLKESGFTQEDIDERVELQLVSTKIQDQITEEAPKVTDSEIEEFYDANKEQLQQPASRDIRLVLSKDEKGAQDAADQLRNDNAAENWDKVAKESSSDEATKDSGGVRAGVTEGTYPEPLNAERDLQRPAGRGRGPGRDTRRLLRLPGRRDHRGERAAAGGGQACDPAAAREPASAGELQRLPQRLPRPLDRADDLRR
jgi:parvulin-like peptidyl-prolyl isomerase